MFIDFLLLALGLLGDQGGCVDPDGLLLSDGILLSDG
jgi:hypothetical protein